MTWTAHPDDPSSVALAAEYYAAVLERLQAANLVLGLTEPVAGGDAHSAEGFWRECQDALETAALSYADHAAYPTGFDGEDTIVVYTTERWLEIAGIPDGFRRATEWPEDWEDYDDPAYAYGPIEAGDILGPWILADLRAAVNALVWTVHECGAEELEDSQRTGSAFAAAWADARSAAESDFAAATQTVALAPIAEYVGQYDSGQYYCRITRRQSLPGFSTLSERPRDVDWYARFFGLTTPDDNGDFPGHAHGKWHLWLTDEDCEDLEVLASAPFGQLTMPNACGQPGQGNPTARGYQPAPMYAVCRWDFAFAG